MTEGDIDRTVTFITQNIIRAADIGIPKSWGHSRRHCRSWWNENARWLKKRQQKAWEIFSRYPTATNYIIYKEATVNTRGKKEENLKKNHGLTMSPALPRHEQQTTLAMC